MSQPFQRPLQPSIPLPITNYKIPTLKSDIKQHLLHLSLTKSYTLITITYHVKGCINGHSARAGTDRTGPEQVYRHGTGTPEQVERSTMNTDCYRKCGKLVTTFVKL